jgi:D-xylose transport system substrate-binding protein
LASAVVTSLVAGVAGQATAATTGAASISATSFNRNYTSMPLLKPISAKGKGGIGVIMPDTISSTRWVEFDAPDLTKALLMAGIPATGFSVVNAHGSDATMFADAQADITNGDSVLVFCPLDAGVGAKVESYAKAHGVAVIDYDRLTLGGSRTYYDSFNNVTVGRLIGDGFVNCVQRWHVSKPVVLVMHGADTDNNATLFADGYDAVLAPFFKSGKYTMVGKEQPNEVPGGTWTPTVALTEFQQEYTAHPGINALLMPNDENAAPIIAYLRTKGIKAHTFPVTGQDATLTGLGNILTRYQCGTVYKPIYLEAQAAVALAVYARAGMTPPAALVNGTTEDSVAHVAVKSVLLTPLWVNRANMHSTVIADNFVPVKQLCEAPYATAAECTAAGITP